MIKRILILVTVLGLSLAFAGCSLTPAATGDGSIVVDLGENIQTQNKITVQGSGTVKVTPDVAYVTIGVTTSDKDAAIAQNQNREIMNAIFDALKNEGLTEDDMRTTNYSTYPRYDYEKNEVSSYEVNNMVELTIKDIDNVGKYIDIAAENGANTAYPVRFSLQDESVPYNDALELAVLAAMEKADAIVSVSGDEIAGTLSITENSYGYTTYQNYARDEAADDTASTPITAGELEVTANVTIVYEIK